MEVHIILCFVFALLAVGPAQVSSGGVYTRWGRGDCPDPKTSVYSGIAGGPQTNNRGGGSNYLCLPNSPIYGRTTVKNNEKRAKIYSVEYEGTFGPFKSLDDHGVPCCVCEANQRSTTLMIPGRNSCPNGWTREYDGYLMAEEYRRYRTEYICVDKNGSDKDNTAGESYGANLFPVEGKCCKSGGLPCGPYLDGAELTCVVCSK